MPYDLTQKFVVGISSRALFDLSKENEYYDRKGRSDYCDMMIREAGNPLAPGTSFGLVKRLLSFNKSLPSSRHVEVVVMSRNQPSAGTRICQSVREYGLPITRFFFTGGEPVSPYLGSISANLFLTANEEDVRSASLAQIPAALVYGTPTQEIERDDPDIRIAFDGDGVLFGDEAEIINQSEGLKAFHESESRNASTPLSKGPFAKLLASISAIQALSERKGTVRIKTAIVTARNAPADLRVFQTLESWGIRVDQLFFLGGASKVHVLEPFAPDIFFDDQAVHCRGAASKIPTAQVPSTLFTLSSSQVPNCPLCGDLMIRRIARRGSHAGKPFWGCTTYGREGCVGVIPIA